MKPQKRIEKITKWISAYAKKHDINTLVVGISGGIDSSVVSTLCARSGLYTMVVSMPIRQSKSTHSLSLAHGEWLEENYPNADHYTIDLTKTFAQFENVTGTFSDELAYGLPMSKALRNLQVRVGQEDLGVLATGIIIQNEVGGNLIELVSSLSNLLRERVKMRRKVRVLTSEGRMSGAMLSALPIFIFLALNLVSPKFYGEVWDKPIVTVFLVGGFIWMLLGNFVIYRMVNFKY